ncbi:MAG: sulfurtransferase complex subunit TusD [Moraxellaceae bacterium]|nr:sulfurtransferase complex subunit TusD [Moraxellaceae bacterium]
MNFALFVTAPPAHEQAFHALHFCEAAIRAGHRVERVFFYGDGVLHGNRLITPPQDEPSLLPRWQALAANGTELVICVAAALRRGVLDADNARRFEREGDNLADGFLISGLGQLAESLATAERVVGFTS